MTNPITPNEAHAKRFGGIPDYVFDVFNLQIVQKLKHGMSTVLQDDVLKDLEQRGVKRSDVFDNGWLDVEDHYRKAGWQVQYEKPAFNETGPALFLFQDPAVVKGKQRT